MTTVPPVRLFVDPDGVVPPYAVVQHPDGYWYGLPGSFKTRLSDEDVKDAIPLQPGPAALVEVRYTGNRLSDDSRCDVDINGKSAARRVSTFVAGAFIVSAATQKPGEPVMVISSRKPDQANPLVRPKLVAVPDRKD